jgi:hypothetical protein
MERYASLEEAAFCMDSRARFYGVKYFKWMVTKIKFVIRQGTAKP